MRCDRGAARALTKDEDVIWVALSNPSNLSDPNNTSNGGWPGGTYTEPSDVALDPTQRLTLILDPPVASRSGDISGRRARRPGFQTVRCQMTEDTESERCDVCHVLVMRG